MSNDRDPSVHLTLRRQSIHVDPIIILDRISHQPFYFTLQCKYLYELFLELPGPNTVYDQRLISNVVRLAVFVCKTRFFPTSGGNRDGRGSLRTTQGREFTLNKNC